MKTKSFLIGVLGGIIISIAICCIMYIPYLRIQISSNLLRFIIAFCCAITAFILLHRNNSAIHAITRGVVMIVSSIIFVYILAFANLFVYVNAAFDIHDSEFNDLGSVVIIALMFKSIIVTIIIISLLLLIYNILVRHHITDKKILIGRIPKEDKVKKDQFKQY